jgi:hypothetical protein
MYRARITSLGFKMTGEMFKMGSHKLQRGKGTYPFNIPTQWVKHRKLKKGDEIDCFLDLDGNLILKPAEKDNVME